MEFNEVYESLIYDVKDLLETYDCEFTHFEERSAFFSMEVTVKYSIKQTGERKVAKFHVFISDIESGNFKQCVLYMLKMTLERDMML